MKRYFARLLTAFVLVLIVGGAAYLIHDQFIIAREAAEQSCMSSIAAATGKAWNAGGIELSGKSRELTNEEVKFIIANYGVGDCTRHEYVIDQVHVAIGEVNKASKSKIRVWTNGPDGISRTGDDLVIPWEENFNH